MSRAQNGTGPSKLIRLADLQRCPPGQKVRFLGCVTEYSTQKALLTLEHNHPPGHCLKAVVDVELVLKTLTPDQVGVGQWVNVIGYTQNGPSMSALAVTVQALVLWSAGPLKLDGYAKFLDEMAGDISSESA